MTTNRRTRHFTTRASKGPVQFTLDDVDAPYRAVPAIPATTAGDFMALTVRISEIAGKLSPPDDKKDNWTPPTPQEVADAVNQIVSTALDGFEMVLLPDSLERMKLRVADKEQPLDTGDIMAVFGWLAKVYNGTDDDEDDSDPQPGADNASPGSSAPTPASSSDDTSTTAPTSADGESSPAAVPAAE